MFKSSRVRSIFAVLLLLTVAIAQHQRRMSLSAAVDGGYVRASVHGIGGSSGDSIKLSVSKTARAGSDGLSLSVPPGTRLDSGNSGAQNMVIARISGRMIDENSYEPVSEIVLSDSSLTKPARPRQEHGVVVPVRLPVNGHAAPPAMTASSGVYILEAYCTQFEKDNPSDSTSFSLGRVDTHLACIIDRDDSIEAKQAAVWIYTDRVTYQHLQEKFPIPSADWQRAKAIIADCGLN